MSYELESIRIVQELFYALLNNEYMLKEEEHRDLFREYTKSADIRTLLKQQAEVSNCKVMMYGDVLYLIPNIDNQLLGYTTAELKKELCYSGALNDDYYLSQFIILCMFLEFYDGSSSNVRVREFLKFHELESIVSKELENGVLNEKEKDLEDDEINFTILQERYEALLSKDDITRSRKTKEGFILKIIDFLEKQNLINYLREDEMIIPTEKLDQFMENNLLNKKNLDRVMKVLGEKNDAY